MHKIDFQSIAKALQKYKGEKKADFTQKIQGVVGRQTIIYWFRNITFSTGASGMAYYATSNRFKMFMKDGKKEG